MSWNFLARVEDMTLYGTKYIQIITSENTIDFPISPFRYHHLLIMQQKLKRGENKARI